MTFHDHIVFITGASRGIGLAIAQAFARAGAQVVMTARDEARLQREADKINEQGGKAWVHALDVADDGSVQSAVADTLRQWKRVDILINNAGVAFQGYFAENTVEQAYQEMNVNYFGMLRVTHALLPAMIQQRRGTILNISSLLGIAPFPSEASYSATKAAIIAFSQALREEVRGYNIYVGAFLPGHTHTDMGHTLVMKGAPPPVSVEVVAAAVLRAVAKKRELATISGVSAGLGLFMCRHFPELGEQMMASIARKSWPCRV